MNPENDPKLEVIRKLLAKAEAAGTTPEEREALSAKAGELMIKYGIDEAVARASQLGVVRPEEIVKMLVTCDAPKSYSHEYAVLGCRVAENFGVRGILATGHREGTGVYFIGFKSDVALVTKLYRSLVLQCTLSLAPWYRAQSHRFHTGTERYNAKRGFIAGFATGVGEKLRTIRKQAVADAGGGAEIALRDRELSIESWIDTYMRLSSTRGRRYAVSGYGGGYTAGQRADVGQANVTPTTGPRAIGG